jgi:hypothetical protein
MENKVQELYQGNRLVDNNNSSEGTVPKNGQILAKYLVQFYF